MDLIKARKVNDLVSQYDKLTKVYKKINKPGFWTLCNDVTEITIDNDTLKIIKQSISDEIDRIRQSIEKIN